MKRTHENISAIEIHINFLLKPFLYLLKCLEKRFKIWFICGQISVKTHKQRPECKVSFGWRATTGRILVFVKVGLECECFAAMATLERFRIGVGLSVRSKIRFIGEGLWTKPAFVGSFSYNKIQWFFPEISMFCLPVWVLTWPCKSQGREKVLPQMLHLQFWLWVLICIA